MLLICFEELMHLFKKIKLCKVELFECYCVDDHHFSILITCPSVKVNRPENYKKTVYELVERYTNEIIEETSVEV